MLQFCRVLNSQHVSDLVNVLHIYDRLGTCRDTSILKDPVSYPFAFCFDDEAGPSCIEKSSNLGVITFTYVTALFENLAFSVLLDLSVRHTSSLCRR